LARQITRQVNWPPHESPPWTQWVQSPTRVGELLRRQAKEHAQDRTERRRDYSQMTTEQLLDLFDEKRWPEITEALVERRSAANTAVLLTALDGARPLRTTTAFRVLGRQGDL